MLSLNVITLAYIIGILWGLYLEFNTLIITSIFLFVLWLMFAKKFHLKVTFFCIVCIIGCLYTNINLSKYDEKYLDKSELNLIVTVISQVTEKEYTYKYNCKDEDGNKFILYFKKNIVERFEVGDKLKIIGEFNLPDTARNRRSDLIIEDI